MIEQIKTNYRTYFELNVIYDRDKYTVDDLKEEFIRFALSRDFDIEIDAIESYEIPEIINDIIRNNKTVGEYYAEYREAYFKTYGEYPPSTPHP